MIPSEINHFRGSYIVLAGGSKKIPLEKRLVLTKRKNVVKELYLDRLPHSMMYEDVNNYRERLKYCYFSSIENAEKAVKRFKRYGKDSGCVMTFTTDLQIVKISKLFAFVENWERASV